VIYQIPNFQQANLTPFIQHVAPAHSLIWGGTSIGPGG
jgi:hypothetical protein